MKKILLLILSLGLFLTLTSCGTPDDGDDPIIEEELLTLKKFTLIETENEGELRLVVEIQEEEGTIYYILVKTGAAPTAEQVAAGVNYGTTTVVKHGNSNGEPTLTETFSDLEKNVEYTAYITLKGETKYTAVQSKTAKTFEEVYLGAGTQEDPFLISTIYDLETVGNGTHAQTPDGPSWSKQSHYKLMNDIDLSSEYGEGKKSWVPLQINSDATSELAGVFDGNGHTIKNLYIDVDAYPSEYVPGDLGLFSMINTGAVVKNLTLENVTIIGSGYTEQPKQVATTTGEGPAAAGSYVGALAGSMKGQVINCHIKNGTVTAKGSRVGGMFGRLYGDVGTAIVVKDCSVINVDVSANARVGGIVGQIDGKNGAGFTQTLIENVVFVGTVTATEILVQLNEDKSQIVYDFEGDATHVLNGEYAGGISGYMRGAKVSNVVVVADITACQHFGGIIGFQQRINAADNTLTSVENTLFKGSVALQETIVGASTSGQTQVNLTVGNKSTGNGGTAETVFVANNFYVAGSTTIATSHANSISGTEVLVADLNQAFITTNLPLWTFNISLLS